MAGIFQRLFNIAKAYGSDHVDKFRKVVFGDEDNFDFREYFSRKTQSDSRYSDKRSTSEGFRNRSTNPYPGVPTQVVDDLAVFNLIPPSSLEEVRKARNREIKKYHSDKFINDPERFKTSKEIMQIYNAAYERLREYYSQQK